MALLSTALAGLSPVAATSATLQLAWDPSPDASSYQVYYGVGSGSYTNTLAAGSATNATISGLREGTTYYFSATALAASGLESDFSGEISYTVPVTSGNQPPTLNALAGVTVNQNSGARTVNLAGISSGSASENQTLTVTATSSNPSLIPNPAVSYLSPATTGTITFTPVAGQYGTATITVTVNDNQPTNNALSRTFAVNVNALPGITTIANQATTVGYPTAPIAFRVSDYETLPDNLILTAASSAPGLVPTNNIFFGGSGTNRTVTLTPVAAQSGNATISITVSDGIGSATTSFVLTVAGNRPPDNTAPTISVIPNQSIVQDTSAGPISFAVSDAETPAGSLTLSAGSSNPALVPVANVVFGGSGGNRTITLTPLAGQAGAANITVTVSDGTATASQTFTLNVAAKSATLVTATTVRTVGKGSVSGNGGSQVLAVGSTYTLTATADSGHKFAGWRGTINDNKATITFTATKDMVLEAVFAGPVTPNKSVFNGLVYEAAQVRHESSGAFTLSTSQRGAYSGRLQLGGQRYSFSGVLDEFGMGSNTIARKGASPVMLSFSLGSGDEADQVFGRLAGNGWTASLTGDRVVFDSRKNPARWAGNYTMVLPGQSADHELPTGHGYGTARVAANGKVALAGLLADGNRFSQSTYVSRKGSLPVYLVLYSGQGSALSWLTFNSTATSDLSGDLTWIKPVGTLTRYYPRGFEYGTLVLGSAYQRAAGPMVNAVSTAVAFSGGNLLEDFANQISFDAAGRVSNQSSNRLALSFSAGTGAFRGNVVDPVSGSTLPFSGVVLKKANAAYGLMLGVDQSSSVEIEP